MFENTRKYETSLSRAHNSSYSDILFHFTRANPAAIPLNFSNSYFYDLLTSGFGKFSGVTFSFSKKIRFGITNGPHDDPDVTNLQVYGFTTIESDFRNHQLAASNNNLNLSVFTTKNGLQDFLCFTFSHIGTTWSASDDFTILCKGTVVTTPIIWDYHAHKFFQDMGITQSSSADQIRSSVTRLVCDLKSKYLWNKIVCLYPFVGGTSESHKWNLKNTATYSLSYSTEAQGTVSHSSQGVRITTPSTGFIDTGFPLRPTTKDLAMGVYTNPLVNQNWPNNPTYSVGNLMGSFTTSTFYTGGQLHYSISTMNLALNVGLPSLVYMDVDPIYTRGRYRSQLSTGLANQTPVDRGGLWAMARMGTTFSYLGLIVPGIVQINTSQWYQPFESGILTSIRRTFGRKRSYFDTTMNLSYFTSSIYIGNLNGTLSSPSNQIIKSAFIGFSMSGVDLLYMSEILTKFNHSLNRE